MTQYLKKELSEQAKKEQKKLNTYRYTLGGIVASAAIFQYFGISDYSAIHPVSSSVSSAAMVVMSACAYTAFKPEYKQEFNTRYIDEETLVKKLSTSNNNANSAFWSISTSLPGLFKTNDFYNKKMSLDDFKSFIEQAQTIVQKAFRVNPVDFSSSIENEEQKSWLKRFLNKPAEKLMPEWIKKHQQENELRKWVAEKHLTFENSQNENILRKEPGVETKNDVYKEFNHSMEKVFKESYKDILMGSVKDGFAQRLNECFKEYKVNDFQSFQKYFNNNLREHFEQMSQLYEYTEKKEYKPLSKIAKMTIDNIDNKKTLITIGDWDLNNKEDENHSTILKTMDQLADKQNVNRITNIAYIQKEPAKKILESKFKTYFDNVSCRQKQLRFG